MVITREELIGDTSYISAQRRADELKLDTGWSAEVRRRLGAAKIGVSVVTVAELRSGHIGRELGTQRAREAVRHVSRFPSVAADDEIAEVWAQIDASNRRVGLTFGENDLWVAATAQTLGVPIVTCDRAFLSIRNLDVEVVYLPAKAPAEVSGTR